MKGMVKWAGTEEAFHALEGIFKLMMHADASTLKLAGEWEDDQDEMEDEHYMLETYNGVGIITIKGALIEGSAGWWGMYYDICGYDDIRNATVAAINAGVKEILFRIMSPGGMVVGIGALTDFLKDVNAVIPCQFFTDTYCASGGVWLATTLGNFKASKHAEVGSVGVMAVASEYTEYFKEMGISKRVFKSTPLKASGNPNEKLDDANAAEIQRGVDESAMKFIEHVAQGMGLSVSSVASNIATGQMWYAEDALRLGLLSGITTFDKLLVDLQQKVSQNTNSNAGNVPQPQPVTYNSNAEADMKRKTIKAKSPEEALALAASGIPVDTTADDAASEDKNDDEDQNTDGEGDGEENPDLNKSEDDAEAASTGAPVKEATGLSKLLEDTTDKLVSAKVELSTVKAELAVASARLETMQATETRLKEMVAHKIQHNMAGAGCPIPDMEGLMALSADLLLAQAESAEALLAKRFGTGGRISVVSEEDDEETKKAEDAAKYSEEILAPLSRIFSK